MLGVESGAGPHQGSRFGVPEDGKGPDSISSQSRSGGARGKMRFRSFLQGRGGGGWLKNFLFNLYALDCLKGLSKGARKSKNDM